MNPGADNRSTLAERAESRRDELASGSEDDRRVKLFGRRPCPGPFDAESERANDCALFVTLTRHGKQSPALPASDLCDDVRCGTEAVEAEPLSVAGHSQRPVADQPGAEQRGNC